VNGACASSWAGRENCVTPGALFSLAGRLDLASNFATAAGLTHPLAAGAVRLYGNSLTDIRRWITQVIPPPEIRFASATHQTLGLIGSLSGSQFTSSRAPGVAWLHRPSGGTAGHALRRDYCRDAPRPLSRGGGGCRLNGPPPCGPGGTLRNGVDRLWRFALAFVFHRPFAHTETVSWLRRGTIPFPGPADIFLLARSSLEPWRQRGLLLIRAGRGRPCPWIQLSLDADEFSWPVSAAFFLVSW